MGFNPNTKQFLIYAPTRDGEVFVYYADRPEGPYSQEPRHELGIDPGFFADDDGRLYFLTNRALIHELEPDGLSIKRPVTQIDRTPYRSSKDPTSSSTAATTTCCSPMAAPCPTSRARSPRCAQRRSKALGIRSRQPRDVLDRQRRPVRGTGTRDAHRHAVGRVVPRLSRARTRVLHARTAVPAGAYRVDRRRLVAAGRRQGAVDLGEGAVPCPAPLRLQQSDEFDGPDLGLQWFFTCAPDFSGTGVVAREQPGALRIRTQPGDLHALESLPGVFQQRVIDKAFTFETRVTFDARDGREAAGLHMYHDPLMNFWLTPP